METEEAVGSTEEGNDLMVSAMLRRRMAAPAPEAAAKKSSGPLRLSDVPAREQIARRSVRLKLKYSDDQPRVPAGHPDGGQFAPAHGTAATATATAEADAAAKAVDARDLANLDPRQAMVLRDLYKKAAEAKPGFDQAINEIAASVNGEAKLPDLKGSKRAVEKINDDYRGDASQIKDLLRATIVVKTPAQARSVIDQIKAKIEVLEKGFRNTIDPTTNPSDGYRDVKMNVRAKNGLVAEIQVNIPKMLEAKDSLHDVYKQARVLRSKIDAAGRPATQQEEAALTRLNSQMKAGYDRAWSEILAQPG